MTGDGFAFDCEGPRHAALLTPHALADRTVTNGEWQAFIADGGYRRPALVAGGRLGLGEGGGHRRAALLGAAARARGPGSGSTGAARSIPPRRSRTSAFSRPMPMPAGPARGCRPRPNGKRTPPRYDPAGGNQLDAAGPVEPRPGTAPAFFGDVWEWTGSAYRPYPGFAPAEGAVGEYNGKFMSGQFVLRGGSCATPRGHARASYRNFFYPHQRWQFTGVRLAKDL